MKLPPKHPSGSLDFRALFGYPARNVQNQRGSKKLETGDKKQRALEIYRGDMIHMGMPENKLSILHTSDNVVNVVGELMNQAMGHFQTNPRRKDSATRMAAESFIETDL